MRHLLVLLALAANLASGALAHAEFRGSVPPGQAHLSEPPAEILLEFSEPVSPLVMRFSAGGGELSDIVARSVGSSLVVALPPDAGAGMHLLSWRVLSFDGHPVGGSLVYAVGDHARPAAAAEPARSTARPAAVARFALSLALLLGVGCFVFKEFVLPAGATVPGLYGVAATGSLLVFPAALAAVATQGLDLMGLALDGLADQHVWHAGLTSTTGRTAGLAALAALACLASFGHPSGTLRKCGALAALCLAAASFAASSHAAAAAPRWLASGSLTLHAAALIFWMGALLPLLLVLVSDCGAGAAIRRFSAIAVPAVIVLLATGIVLADLQSGRLATLIGTDYGALLLAKLVGVSALLCLAAYNRVRLTPALVAGLPHASDKLRGTIAAEIVVGLLVIALAAGFRLTVPPRSLSRPQAAIEHGMSGAQLAGVMALSPGQTGSNTARVALSGADGSPLEPQEVSFVFSAPDAGVEAIRVDARPGEGHWETEPFLLPSPGEWIVSIDVLITDFSRDTLSAPVVVGP